MQTLYFSPFCKQGVEQGHFPAQRVTGVQLQGRGGPSEKAKQAGLEQGRREEAARAEKRNDVPNEPSQSRKWSHFSGHRAECKPGLWQGLVLPLVLGCLVLPALAPTGAHRGPKGHEQQGQLRFHQEGNSLQRH